MFCTKCGRELDGEKENCPYCNEPVKEDAVTFADVKDFALEGCKSVWGKIKMVTGIGEEGDKPMKFDRGQWNQEKAKISVEDIIPERQRSSSMMEQPTTLRCPRCQSVNLQIITESSTKGKDFSAGKGCCGAILLGPIGILCGACGKGKQIQSTSYWVCSKCGNKFKA